LPVMGASLPAVMRERADGDGLAQPNVAGASNHRDAPAAIALKSILTSYYISMASSYRQ
jgi:hypothetical protein